MENNEKKSKINIKKKNTKYNKHLVCRELRGQESSVKKRAAGTLNIMYSAVLLPCRYYYYLYNVVICFSFDCKINKRKDFSIWLLAVNYL